MLLCNDLLLKRSSWQNRNEKESKVPWVSEKKQATLASFTQQNFTYMPSQLGSISLTQITIALAMFSSCLKRSLIIFFLLCASLISVKQNIKKPVSIHKLLDKSFILSNYFDCVWKIKGKLQLHVNYPALFPVTVRKYKSNFIEKLGITKISEIKT